MSPAFLISADCIRLIDYLQQFLADSIIAPCFKGVAGMIFRPFIVFILFAGIVTLSGCVYRMDIPQGNRIEPEVIEQLSIGMSSSQVEFLMGTPAVVDLYRQHQWHYIYFLKTGDDGEIEQRRLTLTFRNDLLASIEGDRFIDGER